MKKFKLYFYLLYVLFLIFALFIAVKHEDLVLHWDWDWINTWTGLIRFILQLGGVGLFLFVFEIVLENIHLVSKNRKIKSLEKEVLALKARMYDQSAEDETHEQDHDSESNENLEEKLED